MMNEDYARRLALAEANIWGRDRASVGTHPGSKTIVEVANDYYKFLISEPTKAGDR